MNATDGSCRLNFSRLRRGKTPLEEQEVDAAKNEVCCNQHILLFAICQNANTFCPQGAAFLFREIGISICSFSGIILCVEKELKSGINTP